MVFYQFLSLSILNVLRRTIVHGLAYAKKCAMTSVFKPIIEQDMTVIFKPRLNTLKLSW